MSKLILRCNYFKNESARHRSNYVKYLGTREGVELDPEQLPKAFYEDLDMHGKKENYMDYVAGRPGAIQVPGQRHGLFSNKGEKVDLEEVMKEVAEHEGTVWINVISLKREDAERLGFNKIEAWQNLLRGHVGDIAGAFRISLSELKWYAAFHDEGHHPHVHLLVYSQGKDGYLTKNAIEKLKSVFVRDVFRKELAFLYDEKTKQRKSLKEKAGEELLAAMGGLIYSSVDSRALVTKMRKLAKRLSGIKGKKVYGYLHKDVKAMVDDCFRELEKLPGVKECYEKWYNWQDKICGYYQDGARRHLPMSENPEFKSVKNLIIQEALTMECEPAKGTQILTKPRAKETPDVSNVSLSVLRLLKNLEKTFWGKMEKTQAGRKMITESKDRAKEIERKAALGQKNDEDEDITQSL